MSATRRGVFGVYCRRIMPRRTERVVSFLSVFRCYRRLLAPRALRTAVKLAIAIGILIESHSPSIELNVTTVPAKTTSVVLGGKGATEFGSLKSTGFILVRLSNPKDLWLMKFATTRAASALAIQEDPAPRSATNARLSGPTRPSWRRISWTSMLRYSEVCELGWRRQGIGRAKRVVLHFREFVLNVGAALFTLRLMADAIHDKNGRFKPGNRAGVGAHVRDKRSGPTLIGARF
jgi:hypothetical protein